MTRTYEVRTYGCQMNVHDSERLTGLLEGAGYVAFEAGQGVVIAVPAGALAPVGEGGVVGDAQHAGPPTGEARGVLAGADAFAARRSRSSSRCSASTSLRHRLQTLRHRLRTRA